MKLFNVFAASSIAIMSATSSFAAVIDLGFSLDESGSINTTDFNTTRDALADALGSIPTSGSNQYRIAITTFSNGSNTVIAPTIVTAGNISGLQDALRLETKSGGGTNTAGAITALLTLFQNAGGMSATSIFNITTDGASNSQSATENAALAAYNAGVDGISFEGVGLGLSANDLDNMAKIASLGTTGVLGNASVITDLSLIPNATQKGFVIKVTDFADYEAAISAKVQKVVIDTDPLNQVPLPAGLPLMLAGLGALGLLRRKQAA